MKIVSEDEPLTSKFPVIKQQAPSPLPKSKPLPPLPKSEPRGISELEPQRVPTPPPLPKSVIEQRVPTPPPLPKSVIEQRVPTPPPPHLSTPPPLPKSVIELKKPCSVKSKNRYDENYECNEKTGRWERKKEMILKIPRSNCTELGLVKNRIKGTCREPCNRKTQSVSQKTGECITKPKSKKD